MSNFILDLELLHRQIFGGKPYHISDSGKAPELPPFNINATKDNSTSSPSGKSTLQEIYLGKEIWLPVRLFDLKNIGFSFNELLLPYCTVKISGGKSIVKTSLAERKGTVKELYSVDDYSISIKGFAIDDKRRLWPEEQLQALKFIHESTTSIGLDNALTNVFLEDMGHRVVTEKIDFPEVSGGRKHVRPFVISMESDSVFNLIVDK